MSRGPIDDRIASIAKEATTALGIDRAGSQSGTAKRPPKKPVRTSPHRPPKRPLKTKASRPPKGAA